MATEFVPDTKSVTVKDYREDGSQDGGLPVKDWTVEEERKAKRKYATTIPLHTPPHGPLHRGYDVPSNQ